MAINIDQLVTRASIEGVGSVVADLKKLGDAFDNVGSGGDGGQDAIAKLGESASNLGNVVGAAGAAGATALGFLAKAAMDAESRLAAMKTAFGGNETAAKAAYKWIEKYSNLTPFKTSDLQGAATKLQGAGLDYKKWVDIAAKMAAANPGKTVDDAAEAIKDAQMGEMERLKEFNLGAKQLADYGGSGQGGAGNAEANMEALKAFVQSNWGTALSDAMGTASGQISTMLSKLEKGAADLGKSLLPELNRTISGITNLADAFNGLDDQTKADIVTLLKWGTVGAIVLSGGLKLAAAISTIRTAMIAATLAKTRSVVAEQAEAAAVTKTACAYGAKTQAMAASRAAWMAQGGMMPAAAGGAAVAGGGMWAKGSLLRLGVGAAGLGLMGYGLYQGYQGGKATANQSLADATLKNAGFWGGAGMTSAGAMIAAKALFGTDLKTTLIIGVAAGIVYGFSRVAGRFNANYSPQGIKDTIEAAVTGGRPRSRMDETVLDAMQKALDRWAQVPDTLMKAFDLASSGSYQFMTKFGEGIRRQWDEVPQDVRAANPQMFNPFAPGQADILGLLAATKDQQLFGAALHKLAGSSTQSSQLANMQRQYDVAMEQGQRAVKAMAVQASTIVGMAAMDWQMTASGAQKKSPVKYAEAAQAAMDTLDKATREFANGMADAAQKIRQARIDQLDDQLQSVGNMLQGIEAGIIPERLRDSYRARRDELASQRIAQQRAMGNDVDAARAEEQMGLTRLREAKADQQDRLDALREQLTDTMGQFDIGKDFKKLDRGQQSAMAGAAPGWFGQEAAALPSAQDVLSAFDRLADALEAAGKSTDADRVSRDKVRWQMGQMADREKAKPNIAREILSTGGIGGLAEAEISRVVSGGYFGRRQSGVYGPYALSGAAAARVRATVSNENERHFRMDLYVHPDNGAADAIAQDAVSRTIRLLPKAFRGAGMNAQMQP